MCDDSLRPFPANVVSSATGLLRDTFSPNGEVVSATLLHALQEGHKAGTSSSTAGSQSSLISHPTARPSFAIPTAVASENETFRSSGRPSQVPREAFEGMSIDEFLQSECEPPENHFEEDHEPGKGKKAVHDHPNSHATHQSYDAIFNSAWHPPITDTISRGPAIDSLSDGDEVVKLLSDPNFQPDLWTGESSGEPYTLTEEEMQISRWYIQNAQAGAPNPEQLQHAVAAARSGRAYEDFASIFDEIDSYQEDVWGYIRPLVEAARRERLITEPTGQRDGPAVHRLRMIVAHLQLPVL